MVSRPTFTSKTVNPRVQYKDAKHVHILSDL